MKILSYILKNQVVEDEDGNKKIASSFFTEGIKVGNDGNLILLNAESGYDVVRRRAEVLYSIRKGKVISKTIPKETKVYLKEEKEVDYKK